MTWLWRSFHDIKQSESLCCTPEANSVTCQLFLNLTERERHQASFGPWAKVAHPHSRAKGGESPLLESQGLGVCMLQQVLMSHWRYFRGGSKYWVGQKVHSGFSNGLFCPRQYISDSHQKLLIMDQEFRLSDC